MVDLPHLTQEEYRMLQMFPAALCEAILRAVRVHIDCPEKSLQVCWLIYTSLVGHTDVYDKIGTIFEESPTLKEMGETIRAAVKALLVEDEVLVRR